MFMDCGGRGCEIKRAPAGFKPATPFGFSYTTAAKPCASGSKNKKTGKMGLRKTCPVQFFFDRGTPKLRFCTGLKKQGYTVSVSSPQEAQRIAREACKCWKANKKSFKKCDVSKFALGKTIKNPRR